jgi:hypothetical protein
MGADDPVNQMPHSAHWREEGDLLGATGTARGPRKLQVLSSALRAYAARRCNAVQASTAKPIPARINAIPTTMPKLPSWSAM